MTEAKGPARPRTSVWLAAERLTKPRDSAAQGSLSRDKVVRAAVRLLDAGGVGGFSMRRLATELQVTPMSLYWYVDNKDDLLELALDAVAGEMELPDPAAGDWAEQLLRLATAWRRSMIAHPWAIRCYGDYLNIGPHSLEVSRCGREVISRSPVAEADRPAALAAIFGYTYGFVAVESRWIDYARQSDSSTDDSLAALSNVIGRMPGYVGDGGVLERRDVAGIQQVRDQDFDRALRWLLAGMTTGLGAITD
jgi:AcrR family transcriptional regulator